MHSTEEDLGTFGVETSGKGQKRSDEWQNVAGMTTEWPLVYKVPGVCKGNPRSLYAEGNDDVMMRCTQISSEQLNLVDKFQCT